MIKVNGELRMQQVIINDLKPSEYNPRKWSKDRLTKLRGSIEKFGVVDPLIVNAYRSRRNIVIGGNMQLKVLKLRRVGLGTRSALWLLGHHGLGRSKYEPNNRGETKKSDLLTGPSFSAAQTTSPHHQKSSEANQ